MARSLVSQNPRRLSLARPDTLAPFRPIPPRRSRRPPLWIGTAGEVPPTGAYADEVVVDTPVAWWRMHETSGVLIEDYGFTGPDADGDVYGSPTFGVGGPAGIGTAMSFVTNPDRIAVAYASKLDVSGSFSIEAWCWYTGAPAELATVFSEHYAGGADPVSMTLTFDTTGGGTSGRAPVFGWYNGSAFKLAVSPSNITADVWHHLVGVYDAGLPELQLWVDGINEATNGAPGSQPSGTNERRIGERWDNAVSEEWWAGRICEVALYGSALSEARIVAHYNAGIGGAPATTPPSSRLPLLGVG
jgi:hypothetical protein